MDTQKQESDIPPAAEKELENINSFAFSSLNQEQAATWLIIKALAKGPKNWSKLEKEINLGTSTLSRKLKKMQKQKLVKRKIIPAFPPRTVYELDKENYPELVNDFIVFSKKLEIAEKLIIHNLSINLYTQKIKKNKQFMKKYGKIVEESDPSNFDTAEEALQYLITDLEFEIYSLIQLMLSSPKDSSPLLSTYLAMILMQKITAITKNLSITPEMKKEAISIINREYEEKHKTLKSLSQEKQLAKTFQQTPSHAPVIKSNETKSFFSK